MLNAMRDGAKSGVLKFFLMGLLVLAAAGLILTDVGGFFRGGVGAGDVAKGKGFKISAQEFDRTVRRTLAQQGITPQQAYQFGLVDQILNRQIQIRMLAREAQNYGLRVNDETVLTQLSEMTESLASDGGSKKQALQQILRSQGISEEEFIQTIRIEIANNLFQTALTSGVNSISDATARDLYQFENEKRDIEYFVLTNKSVKDIEEPTEILLQSFYDTNKNQYLIPERRSVTIATLKQEALENVIEISDEDLQEAYDDNIERFRRDEQRTVDQAIVNNADLANKIIEQIKAGKSVEKASTNVTGEKTAYIGKNDFGENGLLEEIAEPVFSGKEKDIIGPIETALGFHVIKLEKITLERIQPFSEVKKDLRQEILNERMMDEMIDTANLIDDRLASGEDLQAIVTDVGLTTEAFKDFTLVGTNKKDKDLFEFYGNDRSEILAAAFETDLEEASPVMELSDGRYVTIRVDSITEQSFTPYEKVKTEIKKKWLDQQRNAANRLRTNQALDAIKQGTGFAQVAKEYGARVKKKTKLTRSEEVKEPLSTNLQRRLFEGSVDEALSASNKDGQIIARVTALHQPDPSKAKADDLDKIKLQYQSALGDDILTQYINKLSNNYRVRINERLLTQMYGAQTSM
ncbi:MAG: peptidyl-prolyl cis-trans isomerase [Pseudomonadota bacterium]